MGRVSHRRRLAQNCPGFGLARRLSGNDVQTPPDTISLLGYCAGENTPDGIPKSRGSNSSSYPDADRQITLRCGATAHHCSEHEPEVRDLVPHRYGYASKK